MPGKTAVSAFSIASNNYLAMARTFAESYRRHHDGARVWVCVVDTPSRRIDYEALPFNVVFAQDLGIEPYLNFAFRYDILELNTAVKPFVMKFLRDEVGLDRVFYFDPDILVMDRLRRLEEALESNLAVLTPHLTRPIDNTVRPPERVIRMCGTYNLGFVGLRLNDETREFLEWWCDRLFRYCINDLPNGLFVDQSWMDLAPAYLEPVAIVRDPIFNVAYWNLPQRFPEQVDGSWVIGDRRIGFFHFSGLELDHIDVISKHQDRLDLWSRPELRPLFEHYRDLVVDSGHRELSDIEYGYHRFTDVNIDIPRSVRKLIQEVDPEGRRWPNPYGCLGRDAFLSWLVRPIRVGGTWLSRAVLALWQERDDLRACFPDPLGESAAHLASWFVDCGAAGAGYHPSLVDDLRRVISEERDLARDVAPCIDLSNPGEAADWLNESVDGAVTASPLVTRAAMEVYNRRPEVRNLYGDPLGRDRRKFAYWFAVHGRTMENLHPDLVRPVRRSLPLRSRLALSYKRIPLDGRSSDGSAGFSNVPSAQPRTQSPGRLLQRHGVEASEGEGESFGVNLVGYFHGARGAASFAAEIRDLLAAENVPIAVVERDYKLPAIMTSNLIRHPHGAPFATTLLVLPSREWKVAVEALPLATRAGARIAGLVTEPVSSLTAEALAVVSELWVPSKAAAAELDGLTNLVIRVVSLKPPRWITMSSPTLPDLDERRIWLGAVGNYCGSSLCRGVSAVLESLRRAGPDVHACIGVCLVVDGAPERMESELRHLPVKVFRAPARREVLTALLDRCEGWLNLDPEIALAPIHLLTGAVGKPVIGFAPGKEFPGDNREWTVSSTATAIVDTARLLETFVRSDRDRTGVDAPGNRAPVVYSDAGHLWRRAVLATAAK